MMAETAFWTMDKFPLVYEENEIKAVIVDADVFSEVELILDNLLNRDAEPEDAILASSELLKQLALKARTELSANDWETELDEL